MGFELKQINIESENVILKIFDRIFLIFKKEKPSQI
jgi:hypothetical protein